MIKLTQEQATQQIMLSLQALPFPKNWALGTIAQKIAEELVWCSFCKEALRNYEEANQ